MRRRLGARYEVGEAIGSGATSTVHVGRLLGTAGFTKVIAIKRLHAHLASDATLRAILVDEARLVSRISHPNVVGVLDVAEEGGELFLVLEYARGATLAELLAAGRVAPAIAVGVMRDVLAGLHAAHHARDAKGQPLGLVHRDVSPRNVIATTDGIGKILDFGIARARARMSTTADGTVRGSLPYMAPEQLQDEPLTPGADVYGASVVLWEALTGERLFGGESEASIIRKILDHDVRAPSTVVPGLPRALDTVVLRGLASRPEDRFASGLEMALALEASLAPAPSAEIGAWVAGLRESELAAREARIAEGESDAGEGEGERGTGSGRARREAPDETTGTTAALMAAGVPSRGPRRTGLIAALLGIVVLGAVALATSKRAPDGTSAQREPTLLAATGATVATPRAGETATAAATAAAVAVEAPGSATAAVTSPSTSAHASSTQAAPGTTAHAGSTAPVKTASTGTSTAPTHAATTNAGAAAAANAGAAANAPSAGSAACPPYYVDDAGVRRFNRECLK